MLSDSALSVSSTKADGNYLGLYLDLEFAFLHDWAFLLSFLFTSPLPWALENFLSIAEPITHPIRLKRLLSVSRYHSYGSVLLFLADAGFEPPHFFMNAL